MSDITLYLDQLAQGNRSAEEPLLREVYAELHSIADRVMRRERPGHSLQPTALINEAYLRLIGDRQLSFESRAHFFHAASRTMRRIVIDHARRKLAHRRDGGERIDFDSIEYSLGNTKSPTSPEDLISIHTSLEQLAVLDARQARIVELRFFAGLSVEETAEILNLSPKTIKREWALARAWFQQQLAPVIHSSELFQSH
jgi:RNA polymerase sigma-70 factor (ECF subfamily)